MQSQIIQVNQVDQRQRQRHTQHHCQGEVISSTMDVTISTESASHESVESGQVVLTLCKSQVKLSYTFNSFSVLSNIRTGSKAQKGY